MLRREKLLMNHDSMNTQKMSYFSDIDLATLHRTRLNERIQYKLSWFNRRQKYYIPPTANQNVNNKATGGGGGVSGGAGAGVNQKLGVVDHKKSYKSANGTTFISEKNNTLSVSNNSNKTTAITNRQRKSACINNRSASSSSLINGNRNGGRSFTKNLNHCDNSTGEDVCIDKIMANKRQNQNNNNISCSVNSRMNEKQQNPLDNTHVSSSTPVSLASDDPDSQKSDIIHRGSDGGSSDGVSVSGTVHTKYRSGDAINRNTQTMSEKTGDIHYPCTETSASVDQALEEDLNIPHRKRSGTWP